MTSADRYLELLGAASITVSEPSIIVNIAPRDILIVEIYVPSWSASFLDIGLRFNSDLGNNYYSSNPQIAAGGVVWSNPTVNASNRIETLGNGSTSTPGISSILWIVNELANPKSGVGFSVMRAGDTTTNTVPDMEGFTWNNTTQRITSVWLNTGGDGLGGITTMGAGSSVKIFGFDLNS